MGEKELKELGDIKKLLILMLLKSGVEAESIAGLMDIDPGNFSKEFPVQNAIENEGEKGSQLVTFDCKKRWEFSNGT